MVLEQACAAGPGMPPSLYLRRVGPGFRGPPQVHVLQGMETIAAGRAASCPVFCPSRFTSRRHCEFRYVVPDDGPPACWCLRDLGSANGTYVDGERLPERSWHRLLLRQQVGLGGPLSEEPELFVFMVTDTDPNIANATVVIDEVINLSDDDIADPLPAPATVNGTAEPPEVNGVPGPVADEAAASVSHRAPDVDSAAPERLTNGVSPRRPVSVDGDGGGEPPGRKRSAEDQTSSVAKKRRSRSSSEEAKKREEKKEEKEAEEIEEEVEDAPVSSGCGAASVDSDDDVILLDYVPPPPPRPARRGVGGGGDSDGPQPTVVGSAPSGVPPAVPLQPKREPAEKERAATATNVPEATVPPAKQRRVSGECSATENTKRITDYFKVIRGPAPTVGAKAASVPVPGCVKDSASGASGDSAAGVGAVEDRTKPVAPVPTALSKSVPSPPPPPTLITPKSEPRSPAKAPATSDQEMTSLPVKHPKVEPKVTELVEPKVPKAEPKVECDSTAGSSPDSGTTTAPAKAPAKVREIQQEREPEPSSPHAADSSTDLTPTESTRLPAEAMNDDRALASSDEEADRLDLPSEEAILQSTAYSQDDTVIEISDDDEEYFTPSQRTRLDFADRPIKKEELSDEEEFFEWPQELDELLEEEAFRLPPQPGSASPPAEPRPEPPLERRPEEQRPARPTSPPPPARSASMEEDSDTEEDLLADDRTSPPPAEPEPAPAPAVLPRRPLVLPKRAITIGSRTVHITPPAGPLIAQTDALPLPPRGRRRPNLQRPVSMEERPPADKQRRRRRRRSDNDEATAPPEPPPPPPPPPPSEQELRERRRQGLKAVARRNVADQRTSEPERPKVKVKVKVTGRSRGEQLAAELKKVSFNRNSPAYRPPTGRTGGETSGQTPPTTPNADDSDDCVLVPDYVPGITQRRQAHRVPPELAAFNASKGFSSPGDQAGGTSPAYPSTSGASPAAFAGPSTAGPSFATGPSTAGGVSATVKTSPPPPPAPPPHLGTFAPTSKLRPSASSRPARKVTFAPEDQLCRAQLIPRRPGVPEYRPHPYDWSLWMMLSWRYGWLKEESSRAVPPPVAHDVPLRPTALSYRSHDDLVQLFEPLLLHELWHKVSDDWKRRRNPTKDVFLLVVRRNGQDLPQFGTAGTSRSLVVAHCEALVPSDSRAVPELGALGCLDLPQTPGPGPGPGPGAQGTGSGRNQFLQVFAYVKDLQRDVKCTVEQFQKRAGALYTSILPKNLTGYEVVRYTLLLRHREALDKVHWERPVKLTSVSYVQSDLRLFTSLYQLRRSPLLPALSRPDENAATFRLPPPPPPSEPQPHADLVRSLSPLQRETVQRVSLAVLTEPRTPRICVVHGPPGTGKTEVIACMVKQVLAAGDDGSRLLLCAPSNLAVDELTRRLVASRRLFKAQTEGRELKVVRFGRNELLSEDVRPYSVQSLVEKNVELRLQKMHPPKPQSAREAEDLRRRIGTVQEKLTTAAPADLHRLRDLVKTLTERLQEVQRPPAVAPHALAQFRNEERLKLLKYANVITTTLASCVGNHLLGVFGRDDCPFTCCIVDEAGQCTEPEAFVPLQYGVTKLVLVGDHNQLPPTVVSQVASAHGLGRSLLERLSTVFDSSTGASPVLMLRQQYRMQAEICRWPAGRFYGDRLETCAPAPVPPLARLRPYLLLQTAGSSETRHPDGGFFNDHEACLVEKLVATVAKLCSGQPRRPSVGVITPYLQQRRLIERRLELSMVKSLQVDVGTVDGFQGQERDVVILSLVRANFGGDLGFLSDLRRLNVALTRARCCLYICGDLGTLSKNADWKGLIEDAYKRHMVVKETMGLPLKCETLERHVLKAA